MNRKGMFVIVSFCRVWMCVGLLCDEYTYVWSIWKCGSFGCMVCQGVEKSIGENKLDMNERLERILGV